jgi:hypothetical protein
LLNTHFHHKNISDIIYLDRSKTEIAKLTIAVSKSYKLSTA